MTRKIIQIAIDSNPTPSAAPTVYALCNDGTVWSRIDIPSKKWSRMADVPQPPEVE